MPIMIKKGGNVIPLAAAKTEQGSDPLAGVKLLREWGLVCVPCKQGTQIADVSDQAFSSFDYSPDDVPAKFDGKNAALRIGKSGNVFFDLDAPEFIAFFRLLAPASLSWGRQGKPLSKVAYRIADTCKAISWKSPNGEELGSLHANGHTLVPPSIHPSTKEALNWDRLEKPKNLTALEATALGGLCASLALVAQNWPAKGARHQAALALSGFLLRRGIALDSIKVAVRLLCKCAGDNEPENRVNAVSDTWAKLQADEEVTGLPQIAALIGEPVAQCLSKWLPDQNDTFPGAVSLHGVKADSYWLFGDAVSATTFPPVEFVCEPLLKRGSVNMVLGAAGVGKTPFVYQLACDIARGKAFLDHWDVPKARRVAIIDGEMSPAEGQLWLARMVPKAPPNLSVLWVEMMREKDKDLNLFAPEHRAWIDEQLAEYAKQGRDPEVLILDNLLNLTSGMDHSDQKDQDELRHWFLSLKAKGRTIVLVDHENKGGKLFGSIVKAVNLHTLLQLTAKSAMHPEATCFQVKAEKGRLFPKGSNAVTAEFRIEKTPQGEQLLWEIGGSVPKKIPSDMQALFALHDSVCKNFKQACDAISTAIESSALATVKRTLSRLRKEKLVAPKGYAPTTKGITALKEYFPALEVAKHV